MKIKQIKYFIFLFCFFRIESLKINRAIISWDNNPRYEFFWPLVSKAWFKLIGVKPTLIFISNSKKKLDETYGDVIYFKPIDNIPTPFQATVIRLLMPALFPDDFCILSDLDMLPLNDDYFINSVKNITSNEFVVFYSDFYKMIYKTEYKYPRYIICYNAAKGSTFREIFGIKNLNDIRKRLIEWYKKFYSLYNYACDEKILYEYLNDWKDKDNRLKLLNLPLSRINRENWEYSPKKLEKKAYIDVHLLRPYIAHKIKINELIKHLRNNYSF